MANIHDVIKADDVNGVIIGGYAVSGRLFYEGRPQSGRVFCETENELVSTLHNEYHEIKNQCGYAFHDIYRNDAWEIRIDT